ncbi:MAG: DUF4214 domain-containing protein [Acidimicrobiales bacterium]|nr:DUF4214 domain-containing protein [Acidimicrobiales bacterium]
MPPKTPFRRTAVATVAAAIASLLVLVANPAPAAASAPAVTGEACSPGEGVTVVVDFQDEGDIAIGCAEGQQATGFAALTAAGFTYNEDSGPSSFLCQIGHVPSTITPNCWTTGYWAYWKASGDAEWAYATTGADGGPIPVDTIEGWSWTKTEPGSYDGKLPRLTAAEVRDRAPDCGNLDGTGGETAALIWTGCELERNDGTFPGFGGNPDFGLTLDAVMAYGLDGRASDHHAVTALDIVGDRILEYVSDAGFGDGTTERYAGALAKATLAFSIAGRNVNDVNGIDLEAELRARMQTTGDDTGRFSDQSQWGDYSNGFGQALAILALARTEGGVPQQAIDFLLAQQCPGGGFRGTYTTPGGCTDAVNADTDYTSFAIQAMHSVRQTAEVKLALDRAVDFVLDHQAENGAVSGTGVTAVPNTNSTALAAQALRAVGRTTDADEARDWVRGRQIDATDAGDGPADYDLGAIAYGQDAFDAAITEGITEGVRDQWRRATVQGLLAFDAPSYSPAGEEPESSPFDDWATFVARQYLDFADRLPTEAESDDAVAALDAGTVTKGAFIDGLNEVEPSSVDSKIFRLYISLLDRTPTQANFELWQQRYAAGWSTLRAAAAFLATPDSPFRGTTNEQFVALLYSRVLGRPANPAYAARWVRRLTVHGWSRGDVAGYFVLSGEARDRFFPEIRVIEMDRAMLGFIPSWSRFAPQRDALRTNSKTVAQLAEELLTDPEYLARITIH